MHCHLAVLVPCLFLFLSKHLLLDLEGVRALYDKLVQNDRSQLLESLGQAMRQLAVKVNSRAMLCKVVVIRPYWLRYVARRSVSGTYQPRERGSSLAYTCSGKVPKYQEGC